MSTLREHVMRQPLKAYDVQLHRGGQCQVLQSSGRRCRARSTWRGYFHGDSELTDSAWVLIEVCAHHAEVVFKYDARYQVVRGNRA